MEWSATPISTPGPRPPPPRSSMRSSPAGALPSRRRPPRAPTRRRARARRPGGWQHHSVVRPLHAHGALREHAARGGAQHDVTALDHRQQVELLVVRDARDVPRPHVVGAGSQARLGRPRRGCAPPAVKTCTTIAERKHTFTWLFRLFRLLSLVVCDVCYSVGRGGGKRYIHR